MRQNTQIPVPVTKSSHVGTATAVPAVERVYVADVTSSDEVFPQTLKLTVKPVEDATAARLMRVEMDNCVVGETENNDDYKIKLDRYDSLRKQREKEDNPDAITTQQPTKTLREQPRTSAGELQIRTKGNPEGSDNGKLYSFGNSAAAPKPPQSMSASRRATQS